MTPSNLSIPLVQQIPLLPVWLVMIGGLIASIVCWQSCPQSALLVLLALLLLALLTAWEPAVSYKLSSLARVRGWTTQQVGFYFMGMAAILNLVRAVAYGLLLAAVFVGRRPPPLLPAGTTFPPSPLAPRPL